MRLFWQVCARRLPVAIEAKVEQLNEINVVVRKYSSGRDKLTHEQKPIAADDTKESEVVSAHSPNGSS